MRTIFTFIIFDFYGTLSSDHYFKLLGDDAAAVFDDLFANSDPEPWLNPWMRGELSMQDVTVILSEYLPHSPETILDALYEGCADKAFNPAVHAFAEQQRDAGKKTALVTGNMDVFSEVVVPAHSLDALFDVVLNTSDFGTLDKRVLWQRAFDTFGAGYGYASSLLIEDSADMVSLFRSQGGTAYQYTDDASFLARLNEIGYG